MVDVKTSRTELKSAVGRLAEVRELREAVARVKSVNELRAVIDRLLDVIEHDIEAQVF